MSNSMRRSALGLIALILSGIAACGGDSPVASQSTAPAAAANVLPVVVDAGPDSNSVNTLFTTVTVCAAGSTTNCQTIDHIQVDTGSYGLRVLASALTLSLPVSSASDGNSLVECTQFVDGYSWGPVAIADVQLGGETASSVPIQVIGASNFATVPDACSSTGVAEDTVETFGANGILGIGVFEQDCGAQCATDASGGYYYSCSATACAPITVAASSQVQNPIPFFAVDNNGSFIDLPAVSSSGAATLTGSLIFGIDTEDNNASGSQTVLTVDPNQGYFTTIFAGQSLNESFLDTGTNGIFFNDSSIAVCSSSDFSGFYCPGAAEGFSASLQGINGVTTTQSFTIGNAETLATDDPSFTVVPELGGTYSGKTSTFDWGLPFYYGKRVATGIELHSSQAATGPYVAF